MRRPQTHGGALPAKFGLPGTHQETDGRPEAGGHGKDQGSQGDNDPGVWQFSLLCAVHGLCLPYKFHFSVVLLGMRHQYCRIAGTCGFPEPDGLHAERHRGIGLMKGLNRRWSALEEVREPIGA